MDEVARSWVLFAAQPEISKAAISVCARYKRLVRFIEFFNALVDGCYDVFIL